MAPQQPLVGFCRENPKQPLIALFRFTALTIVTKGRRALAISPMNLSVLGCARMFPIFCCHMRNQKENGD
jgi:hypothetical protein